MSETPEEIAALRDLMQTAALHCAADMTDYAWWLMTGACGRCGRRACHSDLPCTDAGRCRNCREAAA